MSYIKAAYKISDDLNDNAPAFDGFFILLLAFAFAVRLFQSLNTRVIELDSYTIIEVARTFGNLGSLSLSNFAVNVHPLYPFLMALISTCGIGYEAAGKVLSILFGTLTVFPVYLMSKGTYGRKVGRYSAFLFAVHPYLFINASNVLRDSMTIFFIVMTFFIAWKGFEGNKDRYLVLAGFTAALAYLTKAEGLFCIVAVFLFIWLRDLRAKETTVRRRLRSTLAFASISLTIAFCLIVIFSLKAHSFSVSLDKPLNLLSPFSLTPGALNPELKALGGVTTGASFTDMALAFFLEFLEAIFAVYVFLLGMNVVRIWMGKRLLPPERYYTFIVITLLLLDFAYFGLYHVFSRRYLFSVVVLLMGFMGYGMRLLEARFANLLAHSNRSVFVFRALAVIFIVGTIAGGLIKGSYYWEPKKASLKVAGRYIRAHFGAGKTILTDDPRIAYYADGSFRALTEEALIDVTKGPAGSCPCDVIALSNGENLGLYKKYEEGITRSGFVSFAIPLPPHTNNVVTVECSKKE